ncbi:hypothetical protein NE237_007449 [Protea cynaroides]|uniref:Uncharacterized protein n=1 Tax=Protea cynaroides TaxID=273540 RepID=A0A9Q0QW45_9MAGN|nr:hypothetical protein NE237_007449 [Protea cynaroides]
MYLHDADDGAIVTREVLNTCDDIGSVEEGLSMSCKKHEEAQERYKQENGKMAAEGDSPRLEQGVQYPFSVNEKVRIKVASKRNCMEEMSLQESVFSLNKLSSRSSSVVKIAKSPKYPPSQNGGKGKPPPISARKLAATLWVMNEIPSPHMKEDVLEERRLLKKEMRGRDRNTRSV